VSEIVAVLRDRALFVNKDADSNRKDLTFNQLTYSTASCIKAHTATGNFDALIISRPA
jgi:hypothetical protein